MRRWIAVAAVIIAALAGWRLLAPEPRLTFTPMESPEGFRALRLPGVSGGFDPLAGVGGGQTRTPAPPPAELCAALFDGAAGVVIGRADAPVRIASFSDYRCPYCRVLSGILADLATEGRARVTYHEWPIFGAPSALAARAALAAARQGGYAALHARLMRSSFVATPAYLEAVAGEIGLDAPRLLADMDHPAVSAALERSRALAALFGMAGTPTLVVGATVVEGAVTRAQLEALIALERGAPAPAACRAG